MDVRSWSAFRENSGRHCFRGQLSWIKKTIAASYRRHYFSGMNVIPLQKLSKLPDCCGTRTSCTGCCWEGAAFQVKAHSRKKDQFTNYPPGGRRTAVSSWCKWSTFQDINRQLNLKELLWVEHPHCHIVVKAWGVGGCRSLVVISRGITGSLCPVSWCHSSSQGTTALKTSLRTNEWCRHFDYII